MQISADVDRLLDGICSRSNLSPNGRDRLKQLLTDYVSLYEGKRRGEVKGLEHEIRLTTNRPIVSRPRVHTEEHDRVIREELEKMLADKLIVPSRSPYSLEVVMVRKKTNDWRMCIDFRPLNRVTIDDKYPLPRISDLLYSVKDSRYFVALDLRSGYWQIPLEVTSRRYTAFRTSHGLFEFQVMPFGLKTAPATFQKNMDYLLGDLREHNVLVYIDDILVHHIDESKCLELLSHVFERLKRGGMTMNLEKSTFFPQSLHYLGHVISEGCLQPDPKKVKALDGVKSPTTVTEVRSLLGMIGYFQNYIELLWYYCTDD